MPLVSLWKKKCHLESISRPAAIRCYHPKSNELKLHARCLFKPSYKNFPLSLLGIQEEHWQQWRVFVNRCGSSVWVSSEGASVRGCRGVLMNLPMFVGRCDLCRWSYQKVFYFTVCCLITCKDFKSLRMFGASWDKGMVSKRTGCGEYKDPFEIGSFHLQYSNEKMHLEIWSSINWSVAMVMKFAHTRWAVPTFAVVKSWIKITGNFYLIQVLSA